MNQAFKTEDTFTLSDEEQEEHLTDLTLQEVRQVQEHGSTLHTTDSQKYSEQVQDTH